MLPANKEDFRAATDREIEQMTKRRFVRPGDEAAKLPQYKPVEQLTSGEKKKALRCRLVFNRKRVELGEQTGKGTEQQTDEVGPAKARLVAQDLKILHKLAPEETYAATPSTDGFRLMLASCRIDEGHEVSSTDFDVAYLQSRPWLNKLVLIVYKNPFTGEDVYEWLSGVIYGM